MSVWRVVVRSRRKLEKLTEYVLGRIQPGLQVGNKVDRKMEFHQGGGGKNNSKAMNRTII